MPELRDRAYSPQEQSPHGMPLLRIHGSGAEALRLMRERVRLFSGDWFRKAGRVAARIVSTGTDREARPRHCAQPRRFRARIKRFECRRARSAGRNPDDRQRARHSQRDIGRSRRRRYGVRLTRFPRRRTHLSIAHPSRWPGRSRKYSRESNFANIFYRSLCGPICSAP